MSTTPPKEFEKILSCVEKALELCEAHEEDLVLKSSQWTLHQHLEHLAITGRSTPKFILDALDAQSAVPLNPNGELLLKLRAFPRGETQAPDFAIPKGANIKKIKQGFLRLKVGLEDFFSQSEQIKHSDGRSEHPRLGGLTAEQWLIFLEIHLAHHLSIIDDELNS